MGRKLGFTAWIYVASILVNLGISSACLLLFFKPAFRDTEGLFAQQQQVEELRADVRRHRLAGDREPSDPTVSLDREAATQKISRTILSLDGSSLAQSLGPRWEPIRHLVTQHIAAASQTGGQPDVSRSERFLTSLDQLLSDEIHTLGTRRQQSIYKATEAQSRILQVLVVNTCIGAFLCVIGLWFVRRWVIQPVGVLKQAIARVRQGDFSPQVSLPRNDELGKLGSQISQMAAQIGRLQDRLVDRERQAAASEMVAHLEEHMRAPLSEIRALSATGAENEVRDREVLECQERIAATVTQFEAWLRDLKGSLAPAKSEPRPVLVSEVVSNVLTAVRPTLERRRVQAVAGIDPRVGEVRIDRLQFEQAIVALVTNAAEASKGGQTVRIVVRPCQISDDSWELEVQDEGSGIPPELMEKIFLPFFTTKRDGNGIGLGLVKAIIGQHGGELHVHSERGKGSRFTVRLPQLTRLVGARA